MAELFETSVAQKVSVNISDWDSLIPALVYRDKTAGEPGVLIDLTTFYFLFVLKRANAIITSYELEDNVSSNAFLSKEGAGIATLNMQGMFEDMRSRIEAGKTYTLVQKVTDDEGLNFVHIIYTIHGKAY